MIKRNPFKCKKDDAAGVEQAAEKDPEQKLIGEHNQHRFNADNGQLAHGYIDGQADPFAAV